MAKTNANEYLGTNLEYFRRKRGYTQVELAELANVSSTFLSRVERGEKSVSTDVLARLKTALDVTYDELLCERTVDTACQGVCAALGDCPEEFVDALERFVRDTRKLM